MLYSNEAKHRERFAVRAKYMTLEPTVNKYVKYIRNIRTIQVHPCSQKCTLTGSRTCLEESCGKALPHSVRTWPA